MVGSHYVTPIIAFTTILHRSRAVAASGQEASPVSDRLRRELRKDTGASRQQPSCDRPLTPACLGFAHRRNASVARPVWLASHRQYRCRGDGETNSHSLACGLCATDPPCPCCYGSWLSRHPLCAAETAGETSYPLDVLTGKENHKSTDLWNHKFLPIARRNCAQSWHPSLW